MASTDIVHRSRIDLWLALLVGATVSVTLYEAWMSYATSPRESIVVGATTIATVALLLACSWPCTYTLTDSLLVIRSGLIRQHIEYRDVVGAELSSSPWAAPALSLRRIKVRLPGRFVLISPRDRARFVEDLMCRVERARDGRQEAQSAT